MKVNKIKNKLDIIILFCMGFFAFSGISSAIILDYLNLPFYFIEILFIPFFIYYFKKVVSIIKVINQDDLKWISFWMILFFISIIAGILHNANIVPLITMYRSIIYIIFIIFIFRNIKIDISNSMFVISFGAIIGEFINIKFVTDETIKAVNLIALSLVIIIPMIKKKFFLTIISFFIALTVSILSGFRICILLTLISFILSFLYMLIINFKKYISNPIYVSIFVLFSNVLVFVFFNFNKIVLVLAEKFNMDKYAIFRVTNRLEAFIRLDFATSQDGLRIENFKRIFSMFYDKILVTGLIGKDRKLGMYIDIPFVFLYDLVGSIGAWILVVFIIVKCLKKIRETIKKKCDDWNVVCCIMFINYLILFLINGRFLYITYESILTGIIFSNYFKNRNNKKTVLT